MKEVVVDMAAEVVSFVVLGIIGSGLGLVGVLLEDVGLTSLLAGETAIGLWYLYMGTLALYVAVYLIGVQEIPVRVSAIRSKLSI